MPIRRDLGLGEKLGSTGLLAPGELQELKMLRREVKSLRETLHRTTRVMQKNVELEQEVFRLRRELEWLSN